jgi:hypothetical protein
VIRKFTLAGALLAVSAGTLAAVSTSAGAAVRPHSTVTFTGSITCKLKGTFTANPPLTLSTPQTTKITLKTTDSGCTGNTSQGGSTIKKGTSTGSVTGSYDCESLLSSLPNPAGSTKWKTKGKKAAATDFTLSDGAIDVSTDSVSWDSTQTGSFAGSGSVAANIKQSVSTLTNDCESTKGLKTITIKSGTLQNGTS